MSGNTFGKSFRITTFGESHGTAVGVVIDGCPSGLELSEEDIQKELDRRKPGQSEVTTQRKEEDKITILSGVFEGKTTGAPIAMVAHNKDADTAPYLEFINRPRPSHGDFVYREKYGHYDWRGGGRYSGRETLARVAAGAVAKKLLEKMNVEILAHTVSVKNVKAEDVSIEDIRQNTGKNPVRCADLEAAEKMEAEIQNAREKGDSVGGVIELIALNVPSGLGEPVFDKLDADIAKALMSVGAIKGVEIGSGFGAAAMEGSENNDPFIIEDGTVKTQTNNSGGIQAGISNGMPIVARAAVKPTSSISKKQETVDLEKMENTTMEITGRHDPCIVPRVLPVLEAMLALVLADHALRSGLIS
ncbi:MAG: chorismate synthase, partial [Candidatus Hydrothermarchaeaceae archaeon]